MEKIFNTQKLNIYGGIGMKNKYIYMEREDLNTKLYFIFHIDDIVNDKFPIQYKCDKLFVLKQSLNTNDALTVLDNKSDILELNNNDVLYNITSIEFMTLFKLFVEYQGECIKLSKSNPFNI